MPANTKKVLEINHPELVITRVFDAPRALVFKAWTEAPRLAAWWGPKAFTNPVCELEARPGGAIRVHMKGPDGTVYPMGGEYHEIDEPRRLVLSTFAEDEEGLLLENLVTVTFEEEGAKTRMVLSQKFVHIKARAEFMVKGSNAGWTQSIDKLGDYVSNTAMEQGTRERLSAEERTITVSRLLAAPRSLVWTALTEPRHSNAWWGPQGFKNTDVAMDFRVGGVWSFNMVGPDGAVHPNRSVFKEITPPQRLVFDHGDKDTVYFVSTWTLEPQGGHTLVTISNVFPSREIRDGIAEKYQAVEGAKQTLAKLEAYVAKL